jgi:hypothetical protein
VDSTSQACGDSPVGARGATPTPWRTRSTAQQNRPDLSRRGSSVCAEALSLLSPHPSAFPRSNRKLRLGSPRQQSPKGLNTPSPCKVPPRCCTLGPVVGRRWAHPGLIRRWPAARSRLPFSPGGRRGRSLIGLAGLARFVGSLRNLNWLARDRLPVARLERSRPRRRQRGVGAPSLPNLRSIMTRYK